MDSRPENDITSEEEINLYDYWKVFVKRKKIFIGIFLVPLVIATIVSLSLPRYYRGESEISNTVLPADDIINFIKNIDDTKKNKIFKNNPDAIISVSSSLPTKSANKATIIVDAKTEDIIPQAIKDIFDYISNSSEFKQRLSRIKEDTDFKIKKLMEAKEANRIFLNQLTNIMKKKKQPLVVFTINPADVFTINPADLIKKDADLSLEIMNLRNVKMTVGTIGPPSISKQPPNSRIRQIIIITGMLSLTAGIFIVLFLDYIERMKARENKRMASKQS